VYLNPITVDGITYNFTEESLKELIKSDIYNRERVKTAQEDTQELYRKLAKIRSEVYDFFTEAFEDNGNEATLERDNVNELLVSIGIDELKTTWSATVEITVTINNIEASSKEEAEDIINDNIEVSGYDLDINDQEVNVIEVTRD
jgi:hypothetical protein